MHKWMWYTRFGELFFFFFLYQSLWFVVHWPFGLCFHLLMLAFVFAWLLFYFHQLNMYAREKWFFLVLHQNSNNWIIDGIVKQLFSHSNAYNFPMEGFGFWWILRTGNWTTSTNSHVGLLNLLINLFLLLEKYRGKSKTCSKFVLST